MGRPCIRRGGPFPFPLLLVDSSYNVFLDYIFHKGPFAPSPALVDEKDPCVLIAGVHIALHVQMIFFVVFLTKFAVLTKAFTPSTSIG